jgi:hypothetical protein
VPIQVTHSYSALFAFPPGEIKIDNTFILFYALNSRPVLMITPPSIWPCNNQCLSTSTGSSTHWKFTKIGLTLIFCQKRPN